MLPGRPRLGTITRRSPGAVIVCFLVLARGFQPFPQVRLPVPGVVPVELAGVEEFLQPGAERDVCHDYALMIPSPYSPGSSSQEIPFSAQYSFSACATGGRSPGGIYPYQLFSFVSWNNATPPGATL